jgi:hypothetical protein
MLHLQDIVLVHEEDVMAWWLRSRKLVLKPMRKGFDSLVFLVGMETVEREKCSHLLC